MNTRRLIVIVAKSLLSLAATAAIAPAAALAGETCPNAASRQGPSAVLPDCRAYEQLTPVDKGDAEDVFPSKGLESLGNASRNGGFASLDGNHFLLVSESSFAGGDAIYSSYVFSRGADRWRTTSLSPGAGPSSVKAKAFDPVDFSEVGLESLGYNHIPGEPQEEPLSVFAGPPGGAGSLLATLPGSDSEKAVVGASTDLTHVVLESTDRTLAPGAESQNAGTNALYEWFGGRLRLINVASDGSLLSPCGAALGLSESRLHPGSTHDAVSSNGSKIFFTAPDPNTSDENGIAAPEGPGCWNPATSPQENPPQVYMRLDGTSTVEVSAPDPGVNDPAGPQPAIYVGAAADGSKVFFLSKAELTPDDTTHALELYEYNTEAPEGQRLVRISRGESGAAEGNIAFVGAISSNGAAVYFTAFGKLAEGASELSEAGGVANLYRYDTETGKTTYIAEVLGADYPLSGGTAGAWYDRLLPSATGPERTERVALAAVANWYTTADGSYLVFGSTLPLTGYNNDGPAGCTDLLHEGGVSSLWAEKCIEMYRYSAADRSLVCVSCAGGPPVDNARFNRSPFEISDELPPRPISEDGSYVFFETLNALVPNTSDDKLHVYEWHEGKISLISSPEDPANAYFVGSSPDGSNVFFGTHAQLVAQDTDIGGDLYDARIDGGFVGLTSSQCTGTGCQGVPGAPPIFATPSSVTFEGVGNFPPSATGATSKHRTAAQLKAEKRAKALKACRSKPKAKRKGCERAVRRRFATKSQVKARKSNRRSK